ncbi:MAG: hypothetical protein IPJ20_08655 [Flammeovirgaceae bacterium]|nr:hypothetical protein [Flammeovirgaceae bacterium]
MDPKYKQCNFNVDVPPSLGTGTILDNALTIGAKGIQASLTSTVVRGKNFKWNLTSNFSKQTSIIKSIKGDTEIVAGASVLKAGQEVGQFYGHLMLHDLHEVDPNTGQPFIPGDSVANYQVASNGWVVDKRTKTPYITQGNYSLGTTFPKFNISFINEFTFRKFLSFGFQIDWVNGGKIYNATKSWMYRDGIHSDYTKEIEINGQSGAWTAFYNGVYNGVEPAGVKNYFYEDGSFVRLRNAYVGFDVAQLVKTKIRKLQLVLSGRNLLTWTNYTGMDPEVSTVFTSGVLYQRVDDHVLPNFRSYQVTLYVGF